MLAGTIKGTAINVPALAGSLPAWDGGVNFGGNAATTINGVAFSASALFPTAGLDGTGIGALTITDSAGRTCSATGFSWALFAQP
jgi:autotransporter translocation and assembly factor TamB